MSKGSHLYGIHLMSTTILQRFYRESLVFFEYSKTYASVGSSVLQMVNITPRMHSYPHVIFYSLRFNVCMVPVKCQAPGQALSSITQSSQTRTLHLKCPG